MNYKPADILRYVYDEKLEVPFLQAILLQKGGFSIAEITDRRFVTVKGEPRAKSILYKLNLKITDEKVLEALENKQYISAFISRSRDKRHVHFLVHQYQEAEKGEHEDEIFREVVQYMIAMSIMGLRLDTPEKVRKYVGVEEE